MRTRLPGLATLVLALTLALATAAAPQTAQQAPQQAPAPEPGAPQAAAQPGQAALPGVRNYTPVDATVACSGAVSPEAVGALKQAGFVSIVNLRTADEEGGNLEAMEKAAAAAGLKYFHVPLPGDQPTFESVDRFLDVARDKANEPILINCASGGRASMMLAIKRVMLDGWSVEKAMAEVPTLSQGMRPAVREFGMAYLKEHTKN
ncbi:MAG: blh 4 [Acidobacteria bacterium]|nr:blh 4 [Acidobacteriota bacterium]